MDGRAFHNIKMEATEPMSDSEFDSEMLDNDDQGLLVQYMNLTDPLTTLKELIESRLATDLKDFNFFLQDAQIVTNLYRMMIVSYINFF